MDQHQLSLACATDALRFTRNRGCVTVRRPGRPVHPAILAGTFLRFI